MLREIFEGIESIGDSIIVRTEWNQSEHYVELDERGNSISFTLQNGPIKEGGVNGCQVDTIIEAAMMIVQGFDEKFPCMENKFAINSLENALLFLELRKQKRISCGVEGYSRI
jgi:hypothetical protein